MACIRLVVLYKMKAQLIKDTNVVDGYQMKEWLIIQDHCGSLKYVIIET